MSKPYCGFPMRFAHTGVNQDSPENTLPSYQAAADLGCEGIEIDINICKDGEIILTHNKNLGYMTFGEREDCVLKEMTVEEIKKIDIPFRNAFYNFYPPIPWTERAGGTRVSAPEGSDECRVTHLLTFPEFDAWLNDYDITVEVEFKDTGMLGRMDEILATSKNVGKYIFFSGDYDVLEEMQAHYREAGKPAGLRLGANIRWINEKTMDFVKRSDLYEVGLNNEAFTKTDVDMLAEMGVKVFSNLGDYTEWWAQLAPMGVTGFKTNYVGAYTEWWQKNAAK